MQTLSETQTIVAKISPEAAELLSYLESIREETGFGTIVIHVSHGQMHEVELTNFIRPPKIADKKQP